MIRLKSNAKINLSLDIVGKREDGYHLLSTVMQTVTLCDYVTLRQQPKGITLSCNLPYIPTDSRNIAYRTAQAFFDYCGIAGGVSVSLRKHIPCGAGLGGGSSNGAAVVEGLCLLYRTPLTVEEKVKLTENIGADIPFFFYGGTALCRGIGEQVSPLPAPERVWLVIVKPSASLSTADVFSSPATAESIGIQSSERVAERLRAGDAAGAFCASQNALEPASIRLCPVICDVKDQLRQTGAVFAAMSGSGSAVYGVFTDPRRAYAAYQTLRQRGLHAFITKPCDKGAEQIV